jgi:hypothetical protein
MISCCSSPGMRRLHGGGISTLQIIVCPDYRGTGSTRDYHLAQIRAFTGWRFPTAADKQDLAERLRCEEAEVAITSEKLLDAACRRFRELRIELPAEPELHRLVNAALNGYFHDLCERVTAQMTSQVRSRMDELLVVPKEEEVLSTFELLKADPANAGIENMGNEIVKLRLLRLVGLPDAPFAKTPMKVLHLLKRRAWNEKASEMREHPEAIRYALLGCLLHVRSARAFPSRWTGTEHRRPGCGESGMEARSCGPRYIAGQPPVDLPCRAALRRRPRLAQHHGLIAVDRGDDRIGALRETMSELLQMDVRRKQYLAMMSGLDIH